MTRAEELIRGGGATIAFDTNAIVGFTPDDHALEFKAFFEICNSVNRLSKGVRSPLELVLHVPSLVHMEVLHDLRVDRAARSIPFDPQQVADGLTRKGIHVSPFDEVAALRASGTLHQWFPSDALWHAAKRDRCMEALGVTGASGKSGLASIDWAIAAQAAAEGWVLVTADSRAEFAHVPLKITKSRLRTLLDELLHERGVGSA